MTENKKLRRLSKAERAVLDMLNEYGPGLDFGGKDAIASHRTAAERLRVEGLITGESYRHINGFTEEGWRVYQRSVRKARRDEFRAFKKDAEKWNLDSTLKGRSKRRAIAA